MATHLSTIYAAELDGIEARMIEVETDINVGLHSFTIVGLADKALSEAKERVNSALKNIGIKPPTRENRRIVVNLAPADIKKTGSHYDLAIALGYLVASDQLKAIDTSNKLFIGELALDGRLRQVNGALNIARTAAQHGFKEIYLPRENAKEAAVIGEIRVIPIAHLQTLIDHLEERIRTAEQPKTDVSTLFNTPFVGLSEIKGHASAKRALMIAAAGGHNVLMEGPPGTGKTMLAQALVSILPPPNLEEIIETTQIYSVAGMLKGSYMGYRPFRAPHQTASTVAVIGGGQVPRPGEVSLAHRGVLFLDELPEFRRDVLEALRQPIENGSITISRVRGNLTFPAKFSLVAAMNPCPCGFYGDEEKSCECSAYEVLRYKKKISGPLLDRIDLQISVPRVKIEKLRAGGHDPSKDQEMREKVIAARGAQRVRLINKKGKFTNAELSSKECEKEIILDKSAEKFIKSVVERSLISPRGYYRMLKVARTIADLEGIEHVTEPELAESFSYRVCEA